MSSFQKTNGRITGDSPGNYCIISFPVTFGQDAWNGFLASKFDFACVWTGNDDCDEADWFVPWKKNVLEARAKGMKLVVIGHKNCFKGGGRQCTHRDKNGRNENMRFGNGQVKEIEWLLWGLGCLGSITYCVYAGGLNGTCGYCDGTRYTWTRTFPFFKTCTNCGGCGLRALYFDNYASGGPISFALSCWPFVG